MSASGYGPPGGPNPYGPPGSPYGGQPYGGQPYGGQPYGGQPYGGQPYGQGPPQRTNPFAVASLVLSVLWLGGVGSLLAVVFGFLGRSGIKRSQGLETGNGLAISGIIIGFVGILGAAALWISLVVFSVGVGNGLHNLVTPHTVNAGQSAAITPAIGGLSSAEVFSVSPVATPDPSGPQPSPGNTLVVADAQLCANGSGATLGVFTTWDLDLADGRRVPAISSPVKTPALQDSGQIPANQCVRGYLGFEIPAGSRPQTVVFTAELFRTYQWRLP